MSEQEAMPDHRSARLRAMLRAVAAGRAEITCSEEPDMFIDGVACCDQYAAHELARAELVRPDRLAPPGEQVPAVLTPAGIRLLADEPNPAATA